MYAALIIDADADAQFAIQNAFSDDPIDFRSVSSAQDGIEAAAGAKTDLILIRIELPTSSGFSVFSKLRRNPATKHIPVVLYASDVADDVFTRHASLRTHAEGYLRLPIQQSELHSLIRPLLSLPAPEPAAPTQQLDVQLQNSDQSTPDTASEWDTEISSEDVESALDSLSEPDMVESIEFDVDPEDDQFEISLSSDEALSDDDLEISSEEVDLDFAPLDELQLPDEDQASEPGAPQEPILLSQPAQPSEPPAKSSPLNQAAATDEPRPEHPAPSAQEPAVPEPTELTRPLQAPAKRQSPPAGRKASTFSPAPPATSAEPSLAQPTQNKPAPAAAKAPASKPFVPAASLSSSGNSQSAINLDAQPEKAPEPAKTPEPAANRHQAAQPKPLASEAATRSASSNSSERRQLLAIKTQLLEKDRELLALREELERHEQESLEQRKERRGQQGHIAELQAAQLEYEESSIVAQERIETLESEITQLKATNEQQSQDLEAANASQDQANEAKSALESEIEALKAELQEERERAETQRKAQEQKNSESTALVASLEKQLQERDTKLRSREEQIEDAQASLSGLLERLKAS